jgi:hypothetical protein
MTEAQRFLQNGVDPRTSKMKNRGMNASIFIHECGIRLRHPFEKAEDAVSLRAENMFHSGFSIEKS